MAKRKREREKVRRGEKAGTRSHLSLLSHCWRQSQQTLRDGGGGGYEALFREELASLSLKRNTVKNIFPPRKDDSPCLADDASPWPFYFSPTYPSLQLSLPDATLPFYILPTLSLFAFQLSLIRSSAYCFRCTSWDATINFLHLNCIIISGHSFYKVFHVYAIADIIIFQDYLRSNITCVTELIPNIFGLLQGKKRCREWMRQ